MEITELSLVNCFCFFKSACGKLYHRDFVQKSQLTSRFLHFEKNPDSCCMVQRIWLSLYFY